MPVVILGLGVVVALASGAQFRRGTSRQWLENYRNPRLPAIYRNVPMTSPVAAIGCLLLLMIAAPEVLGLDIRLDVPDRLAAALGLGAVALAMGLIGLSAVWSVRPPAWLIPGWLRDEDRQLGYVPRRADWLDIATFAFGILLLVATAGLAVTALAHLFGPVAPNP